MKRLLGIVLGTGSGLVALHVGGMPIWTSIGVAVVGGGIASYLLGIWPASTADRANQSS